MLSMCSNAYHFKREAVSHSSVMASRSAPLSNVLTSGLRPSDSSGKTGTFSLVNVLTHGGGKT